ncbi:MAG: hypothetical protein E7813_24665 [Bradyrhizobium sp.]|uniref:hypothetical protein n=1 Tax=Bradyrhizobium sp. TaxID=376 RepID=UPI00121C0C9D|nr:hypothetical protein [Bradyrhizobium sp.]THD59611.1 MAG: hypothetical protein E7813_24665 [Bradyrhizobium sp.]
MSIFSRRLGLALVLAALCAGGQTAHAQTAPVSYWIPGSLFGFGGDSTGGQSLNTYGNFPSFDGTDARGGGFSYLRYNFPNGWFVGSEAGGLGLTSISNINPGSYQGMQVGYNFQNSPVRVFAGFDTLKYNNGIGNPFAPFDNTSNSLSGYSARAGVEFQPTSNLSLSLGVGFSQQPGINSLVIPGASVR